MRIFRQWQNASTSRLILPLPVVGDSRTARAYRTKIWVGHGAVRRVYRDISWRRRYARGCAVSRADGNSDDDRRLSRDLVIHCSARGLEEDVPQCGYCHRTADERGSAVRDKPSRPTTILTRR